MSAALAAQYPRLVAVFAHHVEHWEGNLEHLADAWITEALAAFDDGREFEIAGRYTRDGRPVTVDDSLVDVP